MAAAAPVNAGAWDRRRLLATLAGVLAAAILLLCGLGYAGYVALSASVTAKTPTARSSPPSAAGAGPASGQGRRDAVAAAPMLRVTPQDGRSGTPAPIAAPSIIIPAATKAGPAGVPTGFPHTPAGAIGQLAAIETTALSGMSIPQTNDIYSTWAMPAGVGAASWEMTKNVQAFLGSSGGQAKVATTSVIATPVGAQVKGSDGPDWTLACVLLDVRAVVTTDARIGYGHCERMQWVQAPTGGRWMIAPGPPPARAPSTWPGTQLSIRAGWRTWVEQGSG